MRQPLFVLRKTRLCQCGCQGYDTLQEILEVLSWSLGCLAKGLSPSARHDGSAWTEQDLQDRCQSGIAIPRAALLQVRGDWEWLEQCFRFRSVSSEAFRWMCNAVQRVPGPLNFHDFSREAAHRHTLITHEAYMEACVREGSPPSTLFHSPGFRIEHVTVDAMHSADLGTFADAIGSLFWLKITHKPWHRNNKAGLASLNADLEMYYAAHRDQNLTKLTPLSMPQILSNNPGYPFLKAKAAMTRHAAEFCLTLARRHQAGDAEGRPPYRFRARSRMEAQSDRHCDLLVELFEGLLEFTTSCSASPFVIEDNRNAMYKYLQALESLHCVWRQGVPVVVQSKLPFHVRPKTHACQHLVEEKIEAFGSPSSFWCYRDEDFIGAVKSICAKTKVPSTLEQRVIQKLRIWAALA